MSSLYQKTIPNKKKALMNIHQGLVLYRAISKNYAVFAVLRAGNFSLILAARPESSRK